MEDVNNQAKTLLVAQPLSRSSTFSNDEQDGAQSKEAMPIVSTQTITDLLDNLSVAKRITTTQCTYLKQQYQTMCTALEKTRNSEFRIMQTVKTYMRENNTMEKVLGQAQNYPLNYETLADKLRQESLQAENSLLVNEERFSELAYLVRGLSEERDALLRERNRLPNEEEIKTKTKEAEDSIKELHAEINSLVTKKHTLHEQTAHVTEIMEGDKNANMEANDKLHALKVELSEKHLIPLQFSKEVKRIRGQKDEAGNLHEAVKTELQALKEDLDSLEKCREQLQQESNRLSQQVTKRQQNIYDTKIECEQVNKKFDCAEHKIMEQTLRKAEYEMHKKRLSDERHELIERVKYLTCERDKAIRLTRRAEACLPTYRDAVKFAKVLAAEKQEAHRAFQELVKDKQVLRKRKALNTEVNALKIALGNQCQLAQKEQLKVEEFMREELKMNLELNYLRSQLKDFGKLQLIKSQERDEKLRSYRMANERHTSIKQELELKDMQIDDYKIFLKHLERQVNEFNQLYYTIKEERNKCMALIALSQQIKSGLFEKLRVKTREVEVLLMNLVEKDELTRKQRSKKELIVWRRDAERNKLSKQVNCNRQLQDTRKNQRTNLEIQDRLIRHTQDNIVKTKEAIARVLHFRDDCALQLIERTEECCVLQERLKILQRTYGKGDDILDNVIEQHKRLLQEQAEIERSIAILTSQNVEQKKLKESLDGRQLQLALCHSHVSKLSNLAADPKATQLDLVKDTIIQKSVALPTVALSDITGAICPLRQRELVRSEQTPAQLRRKLDDIGTGIVVQENKLLEKNYLYEAVSRLVEKLQSQCNKDNTLTNEVAKAVSRHQNGVNTLGRVLKANIAELTMQMTVALQLEQEVMQRREFIKSCWECIEAGREPPSEEMKKDWMRLLQKLKQAKKPKDKNANCNDLEDWTTAPERPNAYIWEQIESNKNSANRSRVEEVKTITLIPYGANTPFFPNSITANMRHYRKH